MSYERWWKFAQTEYLHIYADDKSHETENHILFDNTREFQVWKEQILSNVLTRFQSFSFVKKRRSTHALLEVKKIVKKLIKGCFSVLIDTSSLRRPLVFPRILNLIPDRFSLHIYVSNSICDQINQIKNIFIHFILRNIYNIYTRKKNTTENFTNSANLYRNK